MSYIHVALNC